MRAILLSLLLVLSWPVSAAAQSITVPETVNVAKPGLVIIRATSLDADATAWYSLSGDLQTFPADIVPPKPGVYLGLALEPGTFKLGVIAAKVVNGKAALSEPQVVTVIVGGTPIPPTPVTPTDPFFQTLNAAYHQDTDANKAALTGQLAAIYRVAGEKTVKDKSLTTVGMFFGMVKSAANLLPADALPNVRLSIRDNLNPVLPRDSQAALDDPTRQLIASHFLRIATDLEALK